MAPDPELTRTSASGPGGDAGAAPRRIGRYTIEAVVGEGGMGVVYAGHDPDLDRRVAVKVLRGATATAAQRARLLREARAMARLAHRNVITVHEVGTDADIDFVAMELIHGRSLATWLRDPLCEPRRRDVLRVFREAGHGLAAAHAAGLVHRDFKPHNVLVAGDGRVVVTDFGLARAVGEADGDAGTSPQTAPGGSPAAPDEPVAATIGPSSSTGGMVGTPAYMPPEQFAGAGGDPRGDQFAFCVALWEGLTGDRPFAGTSVEELRRAVSAGVPAEARRALPGRLRRVLVRGLDPEPSRRWPSMDALLAALDRAEALPRRVGMGAIGAIALVCTLALLLRSPSIPAPACPLPATAVDGAWAPSRRAAMPADVAAVATPALDRARDAWRAARDTVCARPPALASRPVALACLDEAGDQLAALVDAAAAAPAARVRSADLADLVPDPSVCQAASPPSVPRPTDAAAAAARRAVRRDLQALVLSARAYDVTPDQAAAALTEVKAAADRAGDAVLDAEVAVVEGALAQRHGANVRAHAALERAAVAADRSGHELVRAHAAIALYDLGVVRRVDPDAQRALRDRAAAALARAADPPALVAALEDVDVAADLAAHRLDDALRRAEHSLAVQRTRGAPSAIATASIRLAEILITRGDAARGRASIEAALAAVRPHFAPGDPRLTALLLSLASYVWFQDPAAAAAMSAQVRVALASPVERRAAAWTPATSLVRVVGTVRFPDGRPAPGADVLLARAVIADAFGVDPLLSEYRDRLGYRAVRVVADEQGRFGAEVETRSVAVAALGDRRSPPVSVASAEAAAGGAASIDLVLGATGAVRGVVVFDTPRPPVLSVFAERRDPSGAVFAHIAPLAADGTWTLSPLAPGRYQISVQDTDPRKTTLQGVDVEVAVGPAGPPHRLRWRAGDVSIEVLVRGDRSLPVPFADVAVASGPLAVRTFAELRRVARDHGLLRFGYTEKLGRSPPSPYQPGDVVARFDGLLPGPVTVCVVPLSDDIRDPTVAARITPHSDELDVVCRPFELAAAPGVQSLVVETPPMKRLPL